LKTVLQGNSPFMNSERIECDQVAEI